MRYLLTAFLFLTSPVLGEVVDVHGDLITAPESVPVGRTFVARIKGDLPFSVEPDDTTSIELLDRSGNLVLLITAADKPITISVSHQIAHPTAKEIESAPLDDKKKFLEEWLPQHNKDEIYQDSHTVKVGDGPGPDPPGPDPPEPDNLTGLAKLVYEQAKSVGNSAEAKQIAENYASSISSIAAGAYKSLDFAEARAKIVSDLYTANHPISEKNAKWSKFFEWLSEQAKALDEQGKLSKVDEIKTMFEQIHKGLEAVK